MSRILAASSTRREFEDAIVFKVALMVKKYLSNNPVKF